MRVFAVGLCAVLAAGTAQGATFYYVSAPYTVSNYEDGVIPTVTTGFLHVDESRLPAGQGLANLRIEHQITGDGSTSAWPDFATFEFQNQRETLLPNGGGLPYSYFQFGANGKIADVYVDTDWLGGFTMRTRGDSYLSPMPGGSWEEEPYEASRAFLRDKGYRESSAKFDRLLTEHTWWNGYRSGQGGGWFTDAVAWAGAVAHAVAIAMPSNFYSIKNCKVAALDVDDFAPPVA